MRSVDLSTRSALALPAVVVGFAAGGGSASEAGGRPIYALSHQAGGSSCLHVELVGVLLRLSENDERLPRLGRLLVLAAQEWGEYGQPEQRSTELREIVDAWAACEGALIETMRDTRGQEGCTPDSAEARAWRLMLAQHLGGFPDVERVIEAYVQCVPAPPDPCFLDWVVSRFVCPAHEIDLWDLDIRNTTTIEPGPPLRDVLPELERLRRSWPGAPALRTYFLWPNSD